MKTSIILLIFSLLTGCTSTDQLHIYNPFPDKDLVLEKKNISCASSADIKIWYVLYGNYLLNTVNTKEIFPSPDYTYKVDQVSTIGDKVISIFTGLFFSVSRHTLRVDTCELAKKQTEAEHPVKNLENPKNDSKMNELEKEVSYLKGKISGIETSFTMIALPKETEKIPEQKREALQTDKDNSDLTQKQNESSYLNEPEQEEIKVQSQTPKASTYSYLLFKTNSYVLSSSEKNKIYKLLPHFKKPAAKLLIVGYADKTGKFKSNLNLSWQRALEVKRHMMRLGINPSSIELSAAGETGEAPRGKSSETSRRVEVYLLSENF